MTVEIAKLAVSREAVPPADPALVGGWRFDEAAGGPFANAVAGGPAAKVVGELAAADGGVAEQSDEAIPTDPEVS